MGQPNREKETSWCIEKKEMEGVGYLSVTKLIKVLTTTHCNIDNAFFSVQFATSTVLPARRHMYLFCFVALRQKLQRESCCGLVDLSAKLIVNDFILTL